MVEDQKEEKKFERNVRFFSRRSPAVGRVEAESTMKRSS